MFHDFRHRIAGHLFAIAFVVLPEGKVKQMLRELVQDMQNEIDKARTEQKSP